MPRGPGFSERWISRARAPLAVSDPLDVLTPVLGVRAFSGAEHRFPRCEKLFPSSQVKLYTTFCGLGIR